MDIMKVKLSNGFLRNIVSKLIANAISKRFGYKIDIQLEELGISSIDGETLVTLKAEAKLPTKDFNNIIRGTGLEE